MIGNLASGWGWTNGIADASTGSGGSSGNTLANNLGIA